MSTLQLGPGDELYYEYYKPSRIDGVTFVFFNALTSDTQSWETVIAPALRLEGHGTLTFNYRGQVNSPFSDNLTLDDSLIVADTRRLLDEVQPQQPLLVGLSIGGLFAAQAILAGTTVCGLVLINTLRQDGPRLRWIGDALVRTVSLGNLDLFRDLFLPLLVNENWLGKNREAFLDPSASYKPMERNSGYYKLLSEAGRNSNWNIAYKDIAVPCLVITGLQDHVFLDPKVVDNLFSRLPQGYRVDCEDAGHLLPLEIPEELVAHLLKFTKEVH